MDLFGRFKCVDSADKDKSSGSGSVLSRDHNTELLLWKNIFLEPPTVPFSGESRYLTTLWVSGNEEHGKELYRSDSSQSKTTCFESIAENIVPYHQNIKKIRGALKLLTFRDQHVLVQFWSDCIVGKHQLLTTIDQPFGLGVVSEDLCFYRRDSERNAFLVDKDHEEDDSSAPARVFRQGLPEWTPDLTNYSRKDFPQQDLAIHCNLYGYLALPVFDSTTGLCFGVLELLMSSKNTGYTFEVEQIHQALKTENLTSPQVFDSSSSEVLSECRKNELDKICSILKTTCDIHNLPLAQTWAVSPSTSFVAHNKIIEKSCSSFDTRCIGKVCMSTNALPFYVRDLRIWSFRDACKEQHLDKSCSLPGRALSTHGSSYCQDVSELKEEEYPLVHNARMSGLTSCFTIFLHGIESNDDYVLEFFLPLDCKDGIHVLNLVQMLKEVVSGFELGEISPLEFSGPPKDASYLSSSIKPHTIQIFSTTTGNTLVLGMDSSDSESFFENVSKTDSVNVPSECLSKESYPDKQSDIITNTEISVWNDVRSDNNSVIGSRNNDNATSYPIVVTQKPSYTITDGGEKSNNLKRGRKRKIDSLTMEAVKQHVGKPIDQAAESFGVSRSTLTRFCRENGIPSWPKPNQSKRTGYVTNSKLSQAL